MKRDSAVIERTGGKLHRANSSGNQQENRIMRGGRRDREGKNYGTKEGGKKEGRKERQVREKTELSGGKPFSSRHYTGSGQTSELCVCVLRGR